MLDKTRKNLTIKKPTKNLPKEGKKDYPESRNSNLVPIEYSVISLRAYTNAISLPR
jgi:hypothetical protein